MSVLHPAWMVDVATGSAPMAVRVLVACQAELNPTARRQYSEVEAVMGALLDTARPARMSALAFERLDMRTPEPDDMSECVAKETASESAVWPSALMKIIERDCEPVWTRRFGGYEEMVLSRLSQPGIKARLIALPPERGVTQHTHKGSELTLVLKGGFNDGHADYFVGEVCEADETLSHSPRAHPGETCVCFTVEIGQLAFSHPLLSLADKFMGWTRH